MRSTSTNNYPNFNGWHRGAANCTTLQDPSFAVSDRASLSTLASKGGSLWHGKSEIRARAVVIRDEARRDTARLVTGRLVLKVWGGTRTDHRPRERRRAM